MKRKVIDRTGASFAGPLDGGPGRFRYELAVLLTEDLRCEEPRQLGSVLVMFRTIVNENGPVSEEPGRDAFSGKPGLMGTVFGTQKMAGAVNRIDVNDARFWVTAIPATGRG